MLPALEPGEVIQFIIPVGEFDDKHWVVFSTTHGVIKKTELSAYGNPRSTGIIALLLDEGDSVISAALSDGTHEVTLATRGGMAVRFKESDVRPMGRAARGVRGISLDEGDSVVSMALVYPESVLLTVTENGYGKRTLVSEYRKTRRGGKGVITINTDERNGPVVAVMEISETDELIVTSQRGKVIRMTVDDIPVQGRNTMGVRIMRLEQGDKVIGVDRIAAGTGNGNGLEPEPPKELPPSGREPEGCKCEPESGPEGPPSSPPTNSQGPPQNHSGG
jgi:DNA gyrase subunit A